MGRNAEQFMEQICYWWTNIADGEEKNKYMKGIIEQWDRLERETKLSVTKLSLMQEIKIKKLTDTAKIPTRKDLDVGYDLYADSIEQEENAIIIRTGIAIEMPEGLWGFIADRSSMGKKGFNVHGGIIDNSYRGEIIVILYKHKNNLEVLVGDKIAQLILMQQIICPIQEVRELSLTQRGNKGFGSTDK